MENELDCENPPEVSREAELPELVEQVQERLKQIQLPLTPKTDFKFLSKFLRVRKYKVEFAVASVQSYYENIFRNLRRFEEIKPSHFTAVYDSKIIGFLRNKVDGARVVVGNLRNWDTKKFSLREFQLSSIFQQEELLSDVKVQLAGGIVILDMAGLGLSHIRQCTVSEVRIAIQTALGGMPLRIIGIHLINSPRMFWPIYKLVCKLLPEKVRARFHIHSNLEALHNQVDKSILPKALGGPLEDEEAFDTDLMRSLLADDNSYEHYWNGEVTKRPRRLTRKRSSMMIK